MRKVKGCHILMLNGKPVSRREFFKRRLGGAGAAMLGRRTLPMSRTTTEGYSIARSVHPSEVPMMNAMLKARGITGAYYDATKRHNCRITSVGAEAQLNKLFSEMHGSRVYNEDE